MSRCWLLSLVSLGDSSTYRIQKDNCYARTASSLGMDNPNILFSTMIRNCWLLTSGGTAPPFVLCQLPGLLLLAKSCMALRLEVQRLNLVLAWNPSLGELWPSEKACFAAYRSQAFSSPLATTPTFPSVRTGLKVRVRQEKRGGGEGC